MPDTTHNVPDPSQQPQFPVAPQPQVPGSAPAQVGYPVAPETSGQAPYAAAPQTRTNTLAIVSLIGAFFVSLVGIICGHIALSQIKKTGEKGRGLALAGTILGYVFTVGAIIGVILWFVAIGAAVGGIAAAANDISEVTEVEVEAPATTEGSDNTDAEASEPASTEYSEEFCTALIDMSGLEDGGTNADGTVSAEAEALFKQLAETPSPNQAVYERFYAIVEDPMAIVDDTDIMSDYVDAVTEDASACTPYL